MPKELKEILSECMREAGSIEDLAERLASADIVQVVRCEDCKHLIQEIIGGDLELRCACFAGMIIPAPDRYCSCGERREDA